MAAVARTINFRGQKLTRQTTSATEDTYTLTLNPASGLVGIVYVQLVPSTAALYYHTTATLTQTDGTPIQIGQGFTIPVTPGTPFYISAITGSGTLDMTVL